jgi:hypothetical protein
MAIPLDTDLTPVDLHELALGWIENIIMQVAVATHINFVRTLSRLHEGGRLIRGI